MLDDAPRNSICVVDDDPPLCRALGRLLDSAGLQATLFSDPLAFLAHAARQSVALAILDLMMPGLSGLEVQQQLQGISPTTRVIIITGRPDAATRETALAAGAHAYLEKPFNDDTLLAAIDSALSPKDPTSK